MSGTVSPPKYGFRSSADESAGRRHPDSREVAGDVCARRAGSDGFSRNGLLFQCVTGDHVHADIAGAPDEFVNHRPVEKLEPARAAGFSDHDLGDIVGACKVDHVIRDVPARRKGRRHAAKPLGEAQRIGDKVALHLGKVLAAQRLDVERRPGRVQPVREPLRVAHQSRRSADPR